MLKYLSKTIRSNRAFLYPFFIIWCVAFTFTLMQTKAETHLVFNQIHATWADVFFKYFTEAGGWFPWIVIALALFYKCRVSIFLIGSQLVATIITTPLKHLFNVPRPSVLLQNLNYDFHAVEGVKLHTTLSFPSGHTSSAFALFFAIAILAKKPWQKFTCLILACLAGYSRIYLSQHFVQDVLAGSVIGIVAVLLTAYWFTEKQWGEKNILSYIKKIKK